MVQAIPGEQPKIESTSSQEKKRIRIQVVQTPGYMNHSVFLFRSAGGTAFTYRLAIHKFPFLGFDSETRKNLKSLVGFDWDELVFVYWIVIWSLWVRWRMSSKCKTQSRALCFSSLLYSLLFPLGLNGGGALLGNKGTTTPFRVSLVQFGCWPVLVLPTV